jgi:hypothetical protein
VFFETFDGEPGAPPVYSFRKAPGDRDRTLSSLVKRETECERMVWQRGFTPHRLAIPREGHVNGINHEHIIVFRADAKAHAAHAPGRRRDIALWAIAAGA